MQFDMQAALDHLSRKLAESEKMNAINVGVIVDQSKKMDELEKENKSLKESNDPPKE